MAIEIEQNTNKKKGIEKAEISKAGREEYREDQGATESRKKDKEKGWIWGASYMSRQNTPYKTKQNGNQRAMKHLRL
jgi:hypothetical protein